jgi:hypothetical protein
VIFTGGNEVDPLAASHSTVIGVNSGIIRDGCTVKFTNGAVWSESK